MAIGKYGAKAARDASRNVVKIAPADSRWVSPPKEECDPEEPPMVYYLSEDTRITHRQRTKDNRLVDYAIQHEGVLPSRKSDPIMRVDCEHSEVHAHRYYPRPGSREIIRVIFAQSDVEETMQDSYDLVFGEVDKNERSWRDAWQ